MQCLMLLAMGLSAVWDLPPCHLNGLEFGHVCNLPVPYARIALYLSCICLIWVLLLFFLDFLWSGVLTFAFSFGSWWKIRGIQKKTKETAGSGSALEQSKRRLLNIAVQISFCLLLNMVRWTSFKPDSMIRTMITSCPVFNFVGCYHHHACSSWRMEPHNRHLAVLCDNRDNVFQVIKWFLRVRAVLKPVEWVPFFPLGILTLTK